MRKEGKQRAYRINCRPLYSAAWQGINFELKCNAMGWVGLEPGGTGLSFLTVRGNDLGNEKSFWPKIGHNDLLRFPG